MTKVEVREKALAWVPEVMSFVYAAAGVGEPDIDAPDADPGVDGEIHTPREVAA